VRGILTAFVLIALGVGAVVTAGVISNRPTEDPVADQVAAAPEADLDPPPAEVLPPEEPAVEGGPPEGLNIAEAVEEAAAPAVPVPAEQVAEADPVEPAAEPAPDTPVAEPTPDTPVAEPAPVVVAEAAPAAPVAEPAANAPPPTPEPEVAVVAPAETPAPAVAEAVAPPAAPIAPAEALPRVDPPTFDIVRVNPQGGAVIAGRGPPLAEITISAGNQILAQTKADGFGEWVVVPDRALAPGPQDLGIEARLPDGRVIRSEQVVTLLVPGPEADVEERTVAVLQDRGGNAPPRVMQAPFAAPPGQVGELTLDAVQYDEAGNLVLSGKARLGGDVRIFVDGQPIGMAAADAAGLWQMAPDAAVDIGRHDLRLEQINAEGQLVAQISLPFMRASPAETQQLAPGEMIVQPGTSLWRIARNTYGRGVMFTVIYLANADQIEDPDLIYPGQIFTLPTAP
jgi:hypothetical protein